MRRLRAKRVFELSSGLWVVDRVHPVAVVLDPEDAQVRQVVSWAQEPAPQQLGAFRRMFAADDGLWVQENGAGGPLLRIGPDGVQQAVWTGTSLLAAAGPGGAWCARAAGPPRRVGPNDPEPTPPATWDVLLHVAPDGTCTEVRTDAAVGLVHTTQDAAWVCLDLAPWTGEPTDFPDVFWVRWSNRWVRLPWGRTPPARIRADDGVTEAPQALEAAIDLAAGPCDPTADAQAGARRERVAFDVERGFAPLRTGEWPWRVHEDGGSTVLRDQRSPGGREVSLAAAQDVDISAGCWPLVPRPVDADSYLHRVLAEFGSLSAHVLGTSGGHTLDGRDVLDARLLGQWPRVRLEWTFGHTSRPGLVLRRRVELFDEVGRTAYPEYADVALTEDLDTGRIPPAGRARNGVLDM
ncbi:hypothetical protein [Kineococcus arenarius]|uniref:hypothetical protein n=1 Tax=Kineococcus sp. SYSU DK007 TaxID=3383128 RepID=UPI003D7EC9CE